MNTRLTTLLGAWVLAIGTALVAAPGAHADKDPCAGLSGAGLAGCQQAVGTFDTSQEPMTCTVGFFDRSCKPCSDTRGQYPPPPRTEACDPNAP
jgi:hypothetical protein